MVETRLEHRMSGPPGPARGPGAGNTGTGAPAGQQLSLWRALFGGGRGHVALFSCLAGSGHPAGALLAPRSAYFPYPGRRAEALAWVRRSADAGMEVHFCPHLLTGRRRVKENAARIRALWADADEAELPDGFPEPTVCVRSSPGKRHLYWALRRPLSPGEAGRINRRLTHTIGADPGGWALASLLRLPGTRNGKYAGSNTVQIVSHDPSLRYHPREIEQYLKEIPPPAGPVPVDEMPGPLPDHHRPLTVEDLGRLSPKMRALISLGNDGAGKPYASRSEADFAVAIAMFGAGFEEAAIRHVLTDPANGISAKYFERGGYGGYYLNRTLLRARERAEPACGAPRGGTTSPRTS